MVDRRKPNESPPEECPDPRVHETFRYCPYCSWTDQMRPDERVMAALKKAVEARKQDTAFMERLAANIEKHADLLDRLAETPQYGADNPPPWINRYRSGPDQWPGAVAGAEGDERKSSPWT